jgi:hypothetical protein
MYIVIGPRGSDAGVVYIGRDGKIHVQPGWGPEAFLELARALSVIRDAAQLKTPQLSDKVLASGVLEFAFKEIETHTKDGGVLILG